LLSVAVAVAVAVRPLTLPVLIHRRQVAVEVLAQF
jgi:hypothetical protein